MLQLTVTAFTLLLLVLVVPLLLLVTLFYPTWQVKYNTFYLILILAMHLRQAKVKVPFLLEDNLLEY